MTRWWPSSRGLHSTPRDGHLVAIALMGCLIALAAVALLTL